MPGAPKYVTPAMGNRYAGWRAIRKEWGAVHPSFQNRARVIQLIVSLLSPFRAYEDIRLGRKLAHHTIHDSPIFIIGHWRSGTTLLHSLLVKDEQFGYLTNLQGLFPHAFMTNPIVPFLARHLMPATRPMDAVRIDPKTPQEEELALVSYGIYSLYHMWTFPQAWRKIFAQMVAFEESEQETAWQTAYLELLRKISLHHQGKPLVLKNPANTARIPTLLRIFPKARFIYIHRNPVEVYGSTIKLHTRVIPYFQLQPFDDVMVQDATLFLYQKIVQGYLKHKALIPSSQLLEIGYRDLTHDPVEQLHHIYKYFDLPGKREMDQRVRAHFAANPRPPKKEYELPKATLELLHKTWDFVPEDWWMD